MIYSYRFTITDLLTLPQWTDATFRVGGAACTHGLKPLSGLQQCGSQIFSQVVRTKHTVVWSYGNNADIYFECKNVTRKLHYVPAK